MSVRIHVIGAVGASEAELKSALDRIGDDGNGSRAFRIGSSGSWAWANASVWGVTGSDIDQALRSMPVPAFRVTSSDGVLWMLALMGPGKEMFRGVHHFTQVGQAPPPADESVPDIDPDFPDDEIEEIAGINRFIPELEFLWDAEEEVRFKQEYADEAAATIEGLDDYTDYGVTLPESVIAEMKQDPRQALYKALVGHSRQIVEALEEFGLEFDREAMLKLLTVGPLTDLESDSDLGNMPRFLLTLGIDGVFGELPATDDQAGEDAISAGDEFSEAAVDWSEYPSGELFRQVDPLRTECPLSELTGGPLRISHFGLLHLLSHLCAENPIVAATLDFPDESILPDVGWQDLDEIEVNNDGSRWQFCFRSSCWWYGVIDREQLENNDVTIAVGDPQDGTRMELLFVVEGLAEKCQRFAGTWHNKHLELEQTWPPQTARILNDALNLVDEVFGSRALAFSADEEEVVRRNYQRSTGEVPKIRNSRIMPEYGNRMGVVQTLLFQRFENRAPWDIQSARRLIEEDWEEFEEIVGSDQDEVDLNELAQSANDESAALIDMLQKMKQAVEKFQQAQVVPHGEKVVYEGRTGKFLRASMSDLKQIPQEQLEEFNAAMASLGFRCIGDFVGDADQRQEITRCYAGHPQAVALHSQRNESNQFGWAGVSDGAILFDFSHGTTEFHTHFQDGTSLATTSIEGATSKPEAGVYLRCYEDVSIERLWEKHLDGIQRFEEHRNTIPVDHGKFGEPLQFLAMMDEFLARFMAAFRES